MIVAILKSLVRWLIAIIVGGIGVLVLFWPTPPWNVA